MAGDLSRDVGIGFARVVGYSADFNEGVQNGNSLSVLIATLKYTLDATSSAVTNLSLADYDSDPLSIETLDVLGNPYDDLIDYSSTATITSNLRVVPEPNAITIFLIGAAAVCFRRRQC